MTKKSRKDNRWSDIDGGAAFIIPQTLLVHPNFKRLTPYGNKLVMDLARQYTGFNNGYLCSSYSLMCSEGWNSSVTVRKAMLECEHYNLLIRTQHGGLNKPNLHALTWRRIDEKAGKPLEISPTLVPLNTWKEEKPRFVMPLPRTAKKAQRTRLRRVA